MADRPALYDMEITPAMIDAGVSQFCEYQPDTGESLSDRVREIFLAMWVELPRAKIGHN